MPENELLLKIKGDNSSAKSALKGLNDALGTNLKSVDSLVGGFTAGAAAIAATNFLKESIDRAKEQQVETAKLQTAIKNTGGQWVEYAGQVEQAENVAVKMGYTDDEMTKALALLTTMTRSASTAMRDKNLVMDLARTKEMSLAAAASLVAKVEGGKIGIVSRQLPFLNAQMSKEEALAALRKAVAGQAEAYAETGAGAADRLNASYDQLQETIGFAVLPVVTELSINLADLLSTFNELPEAVRSGTVELAVYGGGAVILLVTLSKVVAAMKALAATKAGAAILAKIAEGLAAFGGGSAVAGVAALVAIPAIAIGATKAMYALNDVSRDAYVATVLAGDGYMVAANDVDEYTRAIVESRGQHVQMISAHSQVANSYANVRESERLLTLETAAGTTEAAKHADAMNRQCSSTRALAPALTASAAALQEASYGNRTALMEEAFATDMARSALQRKMDLEMSAGDLGAQSVLANLRVKEAIKAVTKARDEDAKHHRKTSDATKKAEAELTIARNAAKRAADAARVAELKAAIAFGKDIGKAVNELIAYYSKVGQVTAALKLAASYGGYTGHLDGGGTPSGVPVPGLKNRPVGGHARGGFSPGYAQDITWGEDGLEAIVPLSQRYRADALAIMPKVLGALGPGGQTGPASVVNYFKITANVSSDYDVERLAEKLQRIQSTRARAIGATA